MRERYSLMAKARWADPVYKANQGKSIQKPPLCSGCGTTEIDKFYVDASGKRTNKDCKECHKAKAKNRWQAKSVLDKRLTVAHRYGLTAEQYIALADQHGGKCGICGEIPKTARGLHIDHCHATGKVRGLLCHSCNVGIGALRDDPKLLSKALEYLTN